MKGLLIIPIIGLLAVAGVATGVIQVDFWIGDPNRPPATIRDVAAVVEAADRGQGDEDARAVNELLNLATARQGDAGARLVRRHLPPLAAQIETSFDQAAREVEAVEVETEAGVECRRTVLRTIAQQKYVFVQFGARVQRTKSTWRAVDRFRSDMDSIRTSFVSDLGECLALAKPEEREAITQLMSSF